MTKSTASITSTAFSTMTLSCPCFLAMSMRLWKRPTSIRTGRLLRYCLSSRAASFLPRRSSSRPRWARDPRVGRLQVCEKSPLIRVQTGIPLLLHLPDVVACADPGARRYQLLGDLRVVEATEIRHPQLREAVVPVVPVDEQDGAIRHSLPPKKKPRRVAEARHRGAKACRPVGHQVTTTLRYSHS